MYAAVMMMNFLFNLRNMKSAQVLDNMQFRAKAGQASRYNPRLKPGVTIKND